MTDFYNSASEKFFAELAKSENKAIAALLHSMLRERVMKAAVESVRLDVPNLGAFAAGEISICNELSERIEAASVSEGGKANLPTDTGFGMTPI